MTILSVLGSGAFGTALAIVLSKTGQNVTLWSRHASQAKGMQDTRESGPRLPGFALPDTLNVTSDSKAFGSETCLLAIPTQSLATFLTGFPKNAGQDLVACCKGVDRQTGLGPVATIQNSHPDARAAILTGPGFAVDLARGLPTAHVIASKDEAHATALQSLLTRPTLRLYRSTDVVGAELGGALKNVIALAAGMAIGAGLGDSARASVIARGFSELGRYAAAKGAKTETIQGLSGLGDLVLTCTSEKSRNFTSGIALGQGRPIDPDTTVEGLATAPTVAKEAKSLGLDLPLLQAVSDVVEGKLDIQGAIETLLARPVGKE
ncbi:MAG: NAD(P)-dependent glycerol-3-phosphate dehydrogenase [Silicimonas sp.]|nr:NAD(P)-dependent glycerol-3-phosphate dehydrogenase [Silicimonas sp.]